MKRAVKLKIDDLLNVLFFFLFCEKDRSQNRNKIKFNSKTDFTFAIHILNTFN